LQDYAAQNQCSLYSALARTIDNEVFKNTKASFSKPPNFVI